jgi:acetyl-CoA carboxylase biotin carboxyl carrier protein
MGDEMIDIRKLKELVRLMVENDLSELDLKDEQEQVVLRRAYANQVPAAQAAPAPSPMPTPSHAAAPAQQSSGGDASGGGGGGGGAGEAIESPMVGTFYSSPDPESPPFVKVGDTVTPDTVVCIVEAMKVFSEIKADRSGVVTEVCVSNGDAVEYGQPLFRIKPS